MEVSVGDIVFRGEQAGEVEACIWHENTLYALVNVLACHSEVTRHSRKWVPSGQRNGWPANDLEQCAAWYACEDGTLTTLR